MKSGAMLCERGAQVLDVEGLRSTACPCYGLIREIEKGSG